MKKRAFTLAEMMVVMLILTIVLAAFAPMMTKRRTTTSTDSPWKWAANNSDAYFGLSANQTALLGQKEKESGDPNAKLLINSSDGNYMAFKSGDYLKASFSTANGFKFTGSANSSSYATSTAFGVGALSSANANNTAFGYNALHSTSSGTENVAVGVNALYANTGGNDNTAVGYGALNAMTSGFGNTAVGYGALGNHANESKYITAVGYKACAGPHASNVGITCIGFGAGPDHNVSLPSDAPNVGHIYLGRAEFSSGVIDKVHVGELYINGELLQSSDRRLKNVKAEYSKGLEQIRLIKPYNYTFKNNKEERVGVIAQDLQSVLPEAVNKNDDGYLSVKQENIFYTLVNAVKQLDKLVQGLIGEVKTILVKLQSHDDEIQKLKKENQELKQRLEKLEKSLS